MSLLHQEPTEQLDDAARGESFTRGTSPIVLASIVAAVVVTILIAAYVISGQKKPAAAGQVLEVWAHSMHSTGPAYDASGAPIPQESSDHVMVFTRVRLLNQSKNPLFLAHLMANLTLADGVHTSYAAPASEYERIFEAYPDLAQWHATPLNTEATIQPGQSVEGTFVCSFKLTKQEWDARQGLDFTLGFQYQPQLTLASTAPVVEH